MYVEKDTQNHVSIIQIQHENVLKFRASTWLPVVIFYFLYIMKNSNKL